MVTMKWHTLLLTVVVAVFVIFVIFYWPQCLLIFETFDAMPTSGMDDTVPCPSKPIDFRSHGSTRQQYVPVCGYRAQLKLVEVNMTWLPSLTRSDPCLPRLIASHCMDGMRIPNIVHHVWLGERTFTLIHLLSFLSVKFQQPCLVLLHSDVLPRGALWEHYLQQQPRILHVLTSPPLSILGNNITKVEHKADIIRIQVLLEYGGLYMDTDTVLLRNVDELRSHSMVNSYEAPGHVACSTLMAAPQAPFLKLWIDEYRDFKANEWAEHCVEVPARLVKRYPELVHNVGRKFVGPGTKHLIVYFYGNYDWRGDFSIHFYERFDTHVYTVQNVLWMENTVATVARHVLYGRIQTCPSFRTGRV